ncbi:hypothetical protein EPA93_11480 [Ktedonosporobacter rubrisoli]|uniref:Uncharacterized protein n=1 Tax=Ktedonosporobacter rubrisoli TaxID=2509675 RepID=A0A4P6JNC0_KTERU|nr:hypothetical protein [Ktedonosporobacter rubrisoli]QBD76590.1 hypothetical protein EPA93_11480 [Ktedonosporobacter rubrisoli]
MNKQNICTRTFYIVELKEETIRKRLQALLELADPELSIQNSAQYITLRLCTQAPTLAEGEGSLTALSHLPNDLALQAFCSACLLST